MGKFRPKTARRPRVRALSVFGTRPEAVKMAPVVLALAADPAFESRVAVTAQHRQMLDQVLSHFQIRSHYDLDIMRPAQTLTDITVRALERLGPVLERESPDIVLVHGDTATTCAAALAAFYRRITVGHVEAGLRTGERYAPFPEEMNRRLVAVLAELNFAPTPVARENLLREGHPAEAVFVTGNTAVDALLATVRPDYRFKSPLLCDLDFSSQRVVPVEAHRRENHGPRMESICQAVRQIAVDCPDVLMVFSVHPNPEVRRVAHRVLAGAPRVLLCEPFPYQEWANLLGRAHFIISDSGGVQEEAPTLGKPVLLLRDVTERPEALAAGTVELVGAETGAVYAAALRLLRDPGHYQSMARTSNPLGDGQAARRIVAALRYCFGLSPARPDEFVPARPNSDKSAR